MRWVMVLLLAGCVRIGPMAGPGTGPVALLIGDRCGAGMVQGLVGQPFVVLADVDLPGALRVIYPGQEVVSEVQATRLNAAVDGATRITRVYCG